MECGICLNIMIDSIKLNCNHYFCHICIKKWYITCNENRYPVNFDSCDLNNPCPNCRMLSTNEIWDKVINN